MAAMTMLCEEDAKLASQCLEICKTLAGKSLPFSFSVNIGPNFSFSVDTRGVEEEVLATRKKKKTPSTLRRDARRREEYLRKKLNSPIAEKAFKCDQCDSIFKSENGVKIHIGKAHKNVKSTPPPSDRLRQQPGSPATRPTSPLCDVTREEVGDEKGEPVSPPQPPRHLGLDLEVICQRCDRKLFSSMCCAVEEFCDYCCPYDLKCKKSQHS